MELALNFVWVLLTALGAVFWVRTEPAEGRSRSAQLLALALMALVLFPVISVTDDIWAAHNPAEADSCLRRNDLLVDQHTIMPPSALAVPSGQEAQPDLVFLGRIAIREEHVQAPLSPVGPYLFSRPPPAA